MVGDAAVGPCGNDHATATGTSPGGDEGFTSIWSTARMDQQRTDRHPADPRRSPGRSPRVLAGALVLVVGVGWGSGPAVATSDGATGDAAERAVAGVEVETIALRTPARGVRPHPGYSGAVAATGLASAVAAAALTAVSARRRT